MPTHQYSLTLIAHRVNNSIIQQRSADGYINATQLCQVAGKQWHNYVRNETTGHFMRALEAKTRIRVLDLYQQVTDKSGLKSTWVHPKVAIHLAQWLSAEFAVQVSEWVYDWIEGKGSPHSGKLPAHLAWYVANDSRVPTGFFSILQETGLGLFGPLHNVGFDIPNNWVPDISVGMMFCAWLRLDGFDTDELPTYSHDYQDGRVVEANLYPDELLARFRRWFRTEWLPRHGVRYFKSKDPASLVYLDRIPALALASNQPAPKKRA